MLSMCVSSILILASSQRRGVLSCLNIFGGNKIGQDRRKKSTETKTKLPKTQLFFNKTKFFVTKTNIFFTIITRI